ncbi:hypothetical protein NQ176_g5558 [Zarea fungicola]|uniref:Uncharacterized protein n=1 Tax=Zarea fungicola TaxID=93591 RepID=A0ACC1N7V5_9HYPO|nr:hypothetical protein NQ176_g5558 [Lecanicillium fungicola]
MKTFWLFPVAATAAAVAEVGILSPGFAPPAGATSLSRRQLHENTLNNFPSEWIMNTTVFEEYVMANRGEYSSISILFSTVQGTNCKDANHTIYLSDEQAFVSLATVEYDVEHDVHNSSSLVSRESGPCIVPARYTKTYTKQAQQWPGAWSPASSCLWTGKSDAGGSQNIQTSYSIAIEQNAGLSWTVIKDVLTFSLGISVTQTYSSSRTYLCAVNKNSVVQVWTQPYIAWGWFWSQSCVVNRMCGGCGPEYVNGGATAPAKNPRTNEFLNYGCSTGQKNVRC